MTYLINVGAIAMVVLYAVIIVACWKQPEW